VGYWEEGDERRIVTTRGSQLLAMDADTGEPILEFGDGGVVDLRYYECVTQAGRRLSDCDPREGNLTGPRSFTNFSGPIVVGNVAIVGSYMDNHPLQREMDPGDVRAYDVRTGHLRWTFRPVPSAGEVGVETWLDGSWEYSGKGNTWTLISADMELGLVYLTTGAPSNDMYGGHRPGENLFANSIVAVRADTGQRVWHFQTVHHDLWDYDNNAAPILVDITVDGRPIRALVQLSKQSMAYVLDRATGEPVWPIEERPVPASTTPGEWTSPTQPFPTRPAPFDLHGLTIDDLIDLTPELREEAIEIVRPYVMGPIFTPPSLIGDGPDATLGTLQMPGSVGGAEWGGGAFDPETGILYVPSITAAMVADLTPAEGEGVNVMYTRGTREMIEGPQGLPLTRPPWGRITAIDLNTGDHLWMVANGDGWRDHPAIAHLDLPPLGQLGRAMPLLTRTLLFVSEGDPIMVRTPAGGGPDAGKGFRAFTKDTGEVLWETMLPAGTTGPPITYMHDGKQFIVLPIGSVDHGAEWVALALP
jgi:glucose dehydrogenase